MYADFLASWWGNPSLILAPFVFCFGLYAVVNPRGAALLGRRWLWNGNPEPSRAALVVYRVGGIILLLLVVALALFVVVGSFLYHYEY
jgi:hypothetical protein